MKMKNIVKTGFKLATAILLSSKLIGEPSKLIPSPPALKDGQHTLTIPFKKGKVEISGEVQDGIFSLTKLQPTQIIDSSTVSFFADDSQNPLKFDVSSEGQKLRLVAQDTMALIKEVILENNKPIYAIFNNIDPKNPKPDAELAKWNVLLNKDTLTFERTSPFADTLYFPFNQVYLTSEMVRGAILGIKATDSISFQRAKLTTKPTAEIKKWEFKDTTIYFTPTFTLTIHDKEERRYDTLLYARNPDLSIPSEFSKKLYPLKIAGWSWAENDTSRTRMYSGKNKLITEKVYFEGNGVLMKKSKDTLIGFGQSVLPYNPDYAKSPDYLQFVVPLLHFRKAGEKLIVLPFIKTATSYRLETQKFLIYETYDVGTLPPYQRLIDSSKTFKNYHGFEGEVNSLDSISIYPENAIKMAKLYFKAKEYQKATPYKEIDSIPPEVLWASPKDGASINSKIMAKFNEEINRYTITGLGVANSDIDSTKRIGGNYDYQDSTIIFTPNKLFYETNYKVIINGIRDVAGHKMEEYSFKFKTEKDTSTGINDAKTSPTFPPFPNPAENSTTIKISLENPRNISLKIYDMLGNEKTAFEGNLPQGEHNIPIDLSQYPSGVYLIREENTGIMQKVAKR